MKGEKNRFRTLTGLLTLTTTFGVAPVSASYAQPQVEIITDFAGNEYLLFEGENSYEIHSCITSLSKDLILQICHIMKPKVKSII